MNRYEPNIGLMEIHPEGEYISINDLIAAGALVPEKVGEPCEICDTSEDILHVLSDGEIYETGNSDGAFRVHDCKAFQCSYGWIVQPVRLVPIAEWLKGGA